MASNKELITAILSVKPDAVTEGLNNAQLSEMLKTAKAEADAKALANAATTQIDQDLKDKAAKVSDPDTVFKVNAGKSITSKRGILCEGELISAADLSGGEEAFTVLLDKGYITE